MLPYPKTIYCPRFVLQPLVRITQAVSAKTPSHPIVKTVENTQSLGQNISNAGACFKTQSILFKSWDFILTLSAKKSLGTHGIIPQKDCKHFVHHKVPASIYFIITRKFDNYGTATETENVTKWLHTIHFNEIVPFLSHHLDK